MTTLIAMFLVLLSIGLIWIMLRDHRRGTCELLSCRNLALVGLILFQLTSAAYSLYSGDHSHFYIAEPARTGLVFSAMVVVLIVLSLWAYRRGWVVTGLAARVPTTTALPGDVALLLNAVFITALATLLRFGVAIPLISIVAGAVGVGLSAVAGGLVGWVWGRRLLNPVVMFYSAMIVVANLAIVMSGTFGRRGLVTVGGSIIWGMYYSAWRHLRTSAMLWRLAILSIPPILLLALFTSVRSAGEHQRTTREQVQAMIQGGALTQGVVGLLSGQYVGSISLFLIENHPETYEYRHLESIYYFFLIPVPRAWWPDKPTPLSMEIAREARVSKVQWDRLKLAPGIIGHAAAEGGWYALIIYAIVAGLFFRFFDEIIRLNIESPFVVLAAGSALGQYLGLPRGSVPNFALIAVMTVAGSMLILVMLGKMVERLSPTPLVDATLETDEWDEDDLDDEAADPDAYHDAIR